MWLYIHHEQPTGCVVLGYVLYAIVEAHCCIRVNGSQLKEQKHNRKLVKTRDVSTLEVFVSPVKKSADKDLRG